MKRGVVVLCPPLAAGSEGNEPCKDGFVFFLFGYLLCATYC